MRRCVGRDGLLTFRCKFSEVHLINRGPIRFDSFVPTFFGEDLTLRVRQEPEAVLLECGHAGMEGMELGEADLGQEMGLSLFEGTPFSWFQKEATKRNMRKTQRRTNHHLFYYYYYYSRKHGEGFFRWVHLSCSHESHYKVSLQGISIMRVIARSHCKESSS